MVVALDVPPVSHLVEWPPFLFEDTPFAFNKVVLVFLLAAGSTLVLFLAAARNARLVPTGVQNLVEAVVEFIEREIAVQVMGPGGLGWMPLFTTLFFFIFFCNVAEVIPVLQLPATARMALPASLAVMVWVLYNVLGVVKQGPIGYVKAIAVQPGLPKAIAPLVAFNLAISHFVVSPFSLAMRLFANLLAGHLLLVTFAVIASALWAPSPAAVGLPLAFGLLVVLTAFEVLVSVLQAFIFTMLTAVYLEESIRAQHQARHATT